MMQVVENKGRVWKLPATIFWSVVTAVTLCGCGTWGYKNESSGHVSAQQPGQSADYAGTTRIGSTRSPSPPDSVHTNKVQTKDKMNLQVGTSYRHGQSVQIDPKQHAVTIHLTSIKELAQNRPLDVSWDTKRLRIQMPGQWTVQTVLPANSEYQVMIAPMDASGVTMPQQSRQPTASGVSTTFRAMHPGRYNLMVRLPGQKGGHILDILVVGATEPSITKM